MTNTTYAWSCTMEKTSNKTKGHTEKLKHKLDENL
jgi:hypothetical protein